MHRLLPKFSSCLAVLALVGAASIITAAPAAALGPCTTTCYVDANTGNDANGGNVGDPFLTIQKGIDSVSPLGTVNVRPGAYDETAAGRTITQSNGGPSGPYQFGLFVSFAQSGITIQGVTSGDIPITTAAAVQAHITTEATNNFGTSGVFIEGDNVTMRGLAVGVNNPGQNKTIEVIGNNFTLDASDIEDYYGSVYLDDWMYNSGTQTPSVTTYNITNNIFRHGVSLDIASGPGGGTNGGAASGRVISGNDFKGDTDAGCGGCSTGEVYWPAVSFNGAGTTVPWFVDPVGTATISGNTFRASDQYIRHRHGPPDPAFSNWGSFWTGNTFDRAAIATTNGNPNNVASYSYSSTYSFPSVERIGGTIQAAHASGCAGADCDGELTHTPVNGTLLLSAGTFNEVVSVTQTVTIKGVRAGVDARTRSGPESILAPSLSGTPGRTPLEIAADDVTIDGVTVRDNTFNNLFGTGVRLAPGTHGTQFVNNIVKNNISGLFLTNDLGSDPTVIQHNLFKDNTNAGSVSGTDIYADQFTAGVGGVDGATINENTFTNTGFVEDGWALGISNTDATRFTGITFSNNLITNHGRGGYFFSTAASTFTGNTFTPSGTLNHYGFGVFTNGGGDSNTNISIDHNVLGCATSCAGKGGYVDDPAATGIAIIRNNLKGLDDGISSNATATVDGTCNWWGSASSGPTPGQLAGGGPVTTSPWLNNSNLNGPCLPGEVVMVSTGLNHTCALLGDGTARCWGSNSNGQLGDGTTAQRLQPVVVKNGSNTGPLMGITQIVAGSLHTCALMNDGSARCWGKNTTGQLGDGTMTQRLLPVTVKNAANTGPLMGVTQLAAAAVYSCATISGGTARCWGNNGTGQLGDGTMTQRLLPVTVKNSAGSGSLTGVTQLAIRGNHSCARMSNATLQCWGRNANGQLGDGTTTQRLLPVIVRNSANTGALTGVTQVGAGTPHTCARMSDGTAKCWGGNGNGELGDGTTTQRLLPVAVRNSANTGSLTGITQVAPGSIGSCAWLTSGGARCWGYNANGQLGDGTTTQRLLPVVVKNSAGSGPITGVTQLSARDLHSCARMSDATVQCWGGNGNGQIGDGTTTTRLLPKPVPMQ